MKKRLLVGLGNPGRDYAFTRHNLGFLAIEKLAHRHQVTFRRDKSGKALIGEGRIKESVAIFLLPQTYMNLSGEAVGPLLRYLDLPFTSLLVVVDDVALPWGQIRLRPKGASGGHNGLKSIQQHLGSQEYPRLRLGVGGSQIPGQDLADHVLGRFGPQELGELEPFLDRAILEIEGWLTTG